jgi:hypothetical protein
VCGWEVRGVKYLGKLLCMALCVGIIVYLIIGLLTLDATGALLSGQPSDKLTDNQRLFLHYWGLIPVAASFALGAMGYFFARHVSEPSLELRNCIRSIVSELIIHEHIIFNVEVAPSEEGATARKSMRKCAADLASCSQGIALRWIAEPLLRIPTSQQLSAATERLIQLSNTMPQTDRHLLLLKKKDLLEAYLTIESSLCVTIDPNLKNELQQIRLSLTAIGK